jgi:dinuclear metal center YbgI/SA1388 family protein
MKIKDITEFLETIAPIAFQESYDNSGMLIGNENEELTGILITLDTTEEVLEEAIRKKANLIISHHPLIFKGLKQLTGKNYVERTAIKAIKNGINVYAMHTNLDNVVSGVNAILSQKLNLKMCTVLKTMNDHLRKLVTFVPTDYSEKIRQALFDAGAGRIGNYDSCSFTAQGNGSFKAGDNTNPFVGKKNSLHIEAEDRIETIYPKHLEATILKTLIASHPYEEVAYDLYSINNTYEKAGAGMIGELETEMKLRDFLQLVKQTLKTGMLKYTGDLDQNVKKIAVCGGSGAFLLKDAIKRKADVFLSADFKYHDFFDAENKIIIVDAGHYETEQFTKELIFDLLIKKFNTFACFLSEQNTNPINYI